MTEKPTYEELEQRIKDLEVQLNDFRQDRARTNYLGSAVEQSMEGLAVSDLNGKIMELNEAFAKMHGYRTEDLREKNLSIFHTPEQMGAVNKANQYLKDHGEFFGVIWHTRRDGTVFPTLMHNSPFYDKLGNLTGMIGTFKDISELMKAKETLRESEEKYRSLVTLSPDPVVIAQDGRYKFVNLAFTEVFGITEQDAENDFTFFNFVQEKDKEEVSRRYEEYLAGKEGPKYDRFDLLGKDGKIIPCEISATRIQYDGRPAVLVIMRDITEQTHMEEKLRISSEKFSTAFKHSPNPVAITTVNEGRFIEMNHSFLRTCGYDHEEIIGKRVTEFNLWQDHEQRGKYVELLKEHGEVQNFEMTFLNKAGVPGVGLISAAVIYLEDEPAILSTMNDISELNRAKEALQKAHDELELRVKDRTKDLLKINTQLTQEIKERKQTEEALIESEQLYRTLVETSPYGIQEFDTEMVIKYSNKSYCEMVGFSREDLIGKPVYTLAYPETEQKRMREYGKFVFYTQPLPSPYNTSLLTKSGKVIDTESDWNYMRDNNGTLTGIISITTDTTEKKHLQDQLIRSERLAATGQMAATIAHEINSPLQGIKALLYSIEHSIHDEELLDDVGFVNAGIDNITAIVKNLLDLNRPGNEKKQETNINQIIEQALSLLQGHLRKNKIAVNLNLSSEIPDIVASPQQLGQVFLNLINNAVEAIIGVSKPESRWPKRVNYTGEITLSSRRDKKTVVLNISDNGPGLENKEIEHVFDPFYTRKKTMGMGIGLSVCHDIIKDHGGTIAADNMAQGGAVFTITLPF